MIITFSNQKGGVGKTTVCREIGISLSLSGKKVLFVDCDPQGNLSKSLLAQPYSAEFGLYEALNNRELNIEKLSECLFLLKGDIRLSLLEKNLLGEFDAYQRLKELLEREEFSPFDYIFLDTPPSLGILTINALNASDFVILPVSCRLYSMQGSKDTNFNKKYYFTNYDERGNWLKYRYEYIRADGSVYQDYVEREIEYWD